MLFFLVSFSELKSENFQVQQNYLQFLYRLNLLSSFFQEMVEPYRN